MQSGKRADIEYLGSSGIGLKLHGLTKFEKMNFELKLMKKIPRLFYDNKKDIYKLSIYDYDIIEKFLNENVGFDTFVEDRISKIYKNLKRRFGARFKPETYETPSLWNNASGLDLYDYQKEDVQRIIRTRMLYCSLEMGLGKTIEGISTILHCFDMGYKKALVVCSASVKHNWKNEILRFTLIPKNKIRVVGENETKCLKDSDSIFDKRSCKKKNCKNFDKCSIIKSRPKAKYLHQIVTEDNSVVITNYESISSNLGYYKRGDFDIFIFDEVSKMKNTQTGFVKNTFKLMDWRDRHNTLVLHLSGTPIENSITEIYPAFRVMDYNILGSFTNFKNRYLMTGQHNQIIGTKNENELKDRIGMFIIRRTSEEVWKDKPPIAVVNKSVFFEEYQRKIYNDIVCGKLDETFSKSKKINKAQFLSVISYLTMVTGTLEAVIERGKKTQEDCSAKFSAILNIVNEEIPVGKIVLFSRFSNRVLPYLCGFLKSKKIKFHDISKEVSSNAFESIKRFDDDKHARLLICSDKVSFGCNMQNSNNLINFDLPWNPAILDQRIARVYRMGQKKHVKLINLIANNSIDEYVADKIFNKRAEFKTFIKEGTISKSINQSIDENTESFSYNDVAKAMGLDI